MNRTVPNERVIDVWQAAPSAKAAAIALGMRASALKSRVSWLRKQGIPLKEFPKGAPRIDRDSLRERAEAAASKP